jgi:hypothetical protein
VLSIIFLAITSAALAAFMLNRLHVLFTKHQINVKGFTYSRADQPIYYWFWVGAVTFGLCAGLSLFVLSIGVLGGWIP